MKDILSIVIALVVGFILVKILLFVLSLTFAAVTFVLKVALVAVFALPVYLFLRKKLLKK